MPKKNKKSENTNIKKQAPFVLTVNHKFGKPIAVVKLKNPVINDKFCIRVSQGIYNEYIHDDYINICISEDNIELRPKKLAECIKIYDNYTEDLMGNYCLCCRVVSSHNLKYNQIEMSRDLYINFGEPDYATTTFLLYPLFPPDDPYKEILNCDKITLNLLKPDPDIKILRNNEKNCEYIAEGILKNDPKITDNIEVVILTQIAYRRLLKNNILTFNFFGNIILFQITCLLAPESESNAYMTTSKSIYEILEERPKIRLTTDLLSHADLFTKIHFLPQENVLDSQKSTANLAAKNSAMLGLKYLKNFIKPELIKGISKYEKLIYNNVILPIKNPNFFERLNIKKPKGVLLHGPPGCGKTILALWSAHKASTDKFIPFFVINGPSIISDELGSSESNLTGIFNAAIYCAPSIIFIDEIDSLTQSRDDLTASTTSNRIISCILNLFDDIENELVIVISATNRLDCIDNALRRPGRFDVEIEMSNPDYQDRFEILNTLLLNAKHELNENQINEFAKSLHGYLAADLVALCQQSAIRALRRYINKSNNQLFIKYEDFDCIKNEMKPSGLRDLIHVQVENVKWSDIGGLSHIKQQVQETVVWAIKHPENFTKLGIEAPKGLLLYGPPGCSKTLLARAVSTETGANFISIKGSELLNAYVGESEKAINKLFKKAKLSSPCIIFFDEIDGLVSNKTQNDLTGGMNQRVLAQLLIEMDGIKNRGNIIIIGATNRPDLLDRALLRPGRFDRLLYLPIPDNETRKEILNIKLKKMKIKDININEIIRETEGYSGADLCAICREAGLIALDEDIDIEYIEMRHFLKAINKITSIMSRLPKEHLVMYEEFKREALIF